MNMCIGLNKRAVAGGFIALVLCSSPGWAQRPAKRNVQHPQNQKTPRKPGRTSVFAPNRYILYLADEPVAARFAAHGQLQTAAAISYRRQVESRQASVLQELATRGIQVAGAASTVINAVFVVATADRVAELRGIPGVTGVMAERRIRTDLNKATTLANAPQAWAVAAIGGQGNAGSGIKIGILDTGIDQHSPAFNDAGFTAPTGFPKCNAQSDCANYTNNKVIVARSYVSMIAAGTNPANPAADSLPDDYSARDRVGHGSAVAAIAAGVQNSAGSVAFSGMAPKAYLGSYKIYGSPLVSFGATEGVLIKALDDAVADGMDVINMSSGAPAFAGALDVAQCGNTGTAMCDPLASAFELAAQHAVITVSAGNSGQDSTGNIYFNSIISPGTAPSVITVGATVNSHVFNPTVSVDGSAAPSSLKNIAASLSDSFFSPSVVGANSGSLVDITQAPINDNGQACSALPAGSLTDKYALIQRGGPSTCTFDAKAINAVNAGAIGIVFYMADSSTLASPTGICLNNSSGNCDLFGPGVMISLSDGQALKAYIDAHPGGSVTIDTAGSEAPLPVPTAVNNLASYSSLGPAIDGSIKPDMVATGGFDSNQTGDSSAANGLYTAAQSYDPNGEVFSTNGFAAANGTSFAAPLVAGAAALVKQAHPTWTPLEIKSSLVNYSAQDVTTDDFGDKVDVQWIGAGRLDANAAVTASVTAVPSTLSFGYLATGATQPKSIAVTVTNTGSSSVTLAVAVKAVAATTGAAVKADQSSLTLAAGASTKLTVSLSGTVTAAGEDNGAVTLTSTSPAITLRMPYMLLVGDGTSPYAVPLYDVPDYQGSGSTYSYGAVGQDLGQLPVQVLDQWGVPVAGSQVTYTVNPTGSISLQSVPGAPGSTGNALPFKPAACTPSSSTDNLSCTTNNYGIAWVELVDGSTAVGSTNPATVDATTGSIDITDFVSIIAQPTLTSVQDGGAFGNTIAPGSYVALKGSNLVDTNFLINPSAGDKVDATTTAGRLPLTWEYVTASFDAPASGSLPAISVPGYIEYVSTSQINVFMPWELENYPSAHVKMTYANSVPTPSNVLTVPLNNFTPAFLGYANGSVYIAIAQDYVNCPAPYYLIGPTCPATPGTLLVFYANGLGPVSNQPASGDTAPGPPNLAQTTTPPVIMIGGQQAQVQFSGLAPGFVGLYQVNAVIPTGIGHGNQPITIAIGGQTSPATVLLNGAPANIVLSIK
jgi:minor extracellular serine protease Vpr